MNDLDASTFLVELAKQIMHISSQKLPLLKLIQTVSNEAGTSWRMLISMKAILRDRLFEWIGG
jgi:hypothetical protein